MVWNTQCSRPRMAPIATTSRRVTCVVGPRGVSTPSDALNHEAEVRSSTRCSRHWRTAYPLTHRVTGMLATMHSASLCVLASTNCGEATTPRTAVRLKPDISPVRIQRPQVEERLQPIDSHIQKRARTAREQFCEKRRHPARLPALDINCRRNQEDVRSDCVTNQQPLTTCLPDPVGKTEERFVADCDGKY